MADGVVLPGIGQRDQGQVVLPAAAPGPGHLEAEGEVGGVVLGGADLEDAVQGLCR